MSDDVVFREDLSGENHDSEFDDISSIDADEEGDKVNLESSDGNEEMSAAVSLMQENSSTNPPQDEVIGFDENDFPELKGKYKILKRIGEAQSLTQQHNEILAIKRIHRNFAPHRISKEIRLLSQLEGKENVIPLLGVQRLDDQVSMVFPFCDHISFRDYYLFLEEDDIKGFMKGLFTALAYVHSHSIIHRDIKPGNFLCSHKGEPQKKQKQEEKRFIPTSYFLVDFGLAQFEADAQKQIKRKSETFKAKASPPKRRRTEERVIPIQNNVIYSQHAARGGTRGFRAPEVLLKSTFQTCAIDIWSAGVILLAILSGRYPFFDASDDVTSLAEVMVLCGSNEIAEAAQSLGKRLHTNCPLPKQDFSVLCPHLRADPSFCVGQEAFAFLEACLQPNPKKRITAKDALQHPFLKVDAK